MKRFLQKAGALIFSAIMLTTSAWAIDVDSFSDSDSITYKDAVSSLCQLGIIDGKDDGTFDPQGSITRAEAAKLMATFLNDGPITWSSDPAFIGTPGYPEVPTFKDVDEHWAMQYIEYCAALGLVSGTGDGNFDPQSQVTHREFAKMVLVALGYNAEVFDLNGIDWEISVNTLANSLDLFHEVTVTREPATREEICQILNQALSVSPVEREADGTASDGTIVWNYKDIP